MALFALPLPLLAAVFDVRDFGATGDARTPDTAAIQAAIDAANREGGGLVVVPEGAYATGPIELRSNVTLRITRSAVLKAIPPDQHAYPLLALREWKENTAFQLTGAGALSPPQAGGLIYARRQRNIAVEGDGVIDGNGLAFPLDKVRPSVLLFVECEDVRVEGVTTQASAFWTQHYVQSKRILINGVTVLSHLPNWNNDGIDLVECHEVRLTNSTIVADDDAIVFKSSLTSGHGTKDIVVENCVIYGRKSAVKIGTESFGDFDNISIRNLVCYGTRGINLFSVDGGQIKNFTVENVVLRDAYAALLLHVGDRMNFAPKNSPKPPVGSISDITIRNLDATFSVKSFGDILKEHGIVLAGPVYDQAMPVAENFISGQSDSPIGNVLLQNIILRGFPGGGTKSDLEKVVPMNSDHYPLHGMFGKLPAWAFYLRHARNITIENLVLDAPTAEERPALLADDVENLNVSVSEKTAPNFSVIERKRFSGENRR